ncbi:MAG: N-acetylmuramoyl-L-alanine amidase, partial [Clostridia bacterium]|nr:N-acetylmuramoyl-L-alanine amidase [Clostridia bacterium]
ESVDLVVSIHMNKFSDPAVSGAMAFYQTGSEEGQKLAQRVIDEVTDATGRKRRLANPGDYFVLRECACPAVLIECGFLSNAEEEQKLLDPAYQTLLADAIVRGLLAYLGLG